MNTARRPTHLLTAVRAVCTVCAALLLCACGGSTSDEDEPTKTTQPPNCTTNPELCK